jgi:Raf kinase inhibitor-like YbhB/YbcL family protein
MVRGTVFLLLLTLMIAGCKVETVVTEKSISSYTNVEVVDMKLSSVSFQENGNIPFKFTCNGENVNPKLSISDIPEGTKSLTLVVDDPDAHGWVHWLVFNISPATALIEEDSVPKGAVQGKTGFGNNLYGGPCPPSGIHRYEFKLYALNSTLDIGETATKKDVESAMQGHIMARAILTGLYEQKV